MRSARALISALVLAASAATSSPLLAEGDPAQGDVLYRPCRACHMIGDGAVHRVGPHLNGIIDRVIGAVPGYDFSDDLANAGAEVIHAALAECGGHATLVRAPAEVRGSVPVMQPLQPTEMMISRNIKEGFDPNGILNPGRMYAGI